MTSTQQRAELHRQIWQIANEVRGSVDGWDFKQYVLGTLFYRFISENFASYIEAGDESVNYAELPDSVITDDIKDDAIKTKGYFIYPSQLFATIAKGAHRNENLNTDLAAIFKAIEGSANGYPSEPDIKGLFADFDTTSNRLGNTVADKNTRLAAVLKGVAGLKLDQFSDNQIDLFGDAYEYLISNYAANAGKSGGEFFTPQSVSKLIAQIAMHKQETVNKIYDPAAGSGSLLLQAKKHFDNHIIEEGFFGQEINHTTYNLARMNMFLHNINYDKFNIVLGNTLLNPHFGDDKPFDAIVSNPPYSVKWIGSDDPTLINDERFAPAGVLAPKSKADFAFVLHALNYLSSKGRAAIVCFPGIFYRGGAEKKIREYLVDNNYVESVISLAPNLFFGTTISVNILVLSKHKTDNKTQFIDASKLFKAESNTNVLTDEHIAQMIMLFDKKAETDYLSTSIDNSAIAANSYNLSVNSYVKSEDIREVFDINKINSELKTTVAKLDQLRKNIDIIIEEYESYRDKLLTSSESQVEWKALGDIATIQRGASPRPIAKYVTDDHDGVPWIKIGDTTLGSKYVRKTAQKITSEGAKKSRILKKGSFIMSNSMSYGRPYILDIEGAIHDGWASISDFEQKLNPDYLYHYLSSKNVQNYWEGKINSSSVSNLNADIIKTLQVPVLSFVDQERIVAILDKFDILTTSHTEGLPREIELRQQQYEYYRELLLSFPKAEVADHD